MQNSTVDKVKVSARMVRVNATWQGQPVACVYFPDSVKAPNEIATMVAGCPIRGNVVLLGVTTDMIIAEQKRPKAWLSFAQQLPKIVPLDEVAIQNKKTALENKAVLWREYHERKQARLRALNPDDLMTLAEEEEMEREATEIVYADDFEY